jgi:nucleotide-binding universal stress UspA family protein
MLPLRKILCPTDFSEPSFEALKIVNELAMHFSAEILLVHVVPPIPRVSAMESLEVPGELYNLNIPEHLEQLEEEANARLSQIVDKRLSKGLQVHKIVVHGRAADEIVKIAEMEKVDLIVLSTHGETGWQHFFFGSVAERVLRLAKQQVLTIRVQPEKN